QADSLAEVQLLARLRRAVLARFELTGADFGIAYDRDRHDVVLRRPFHRRFRKAERLEQRRMRLLIRFRNRGNLGDETLLVDALAISARNLMRRPENVSRWNLPVLAVMAECRLGPGLHDDFEMLFVQFLLALLVVFGFG